MALNFGGLGFEFEATDDGAEKVASTVGDSLTNLWDNLKKGVPMVAKAGRGMSSGFSMMRNIGGKALGGLALAAAGAIEQATDPKLSSSIDQMMAGFGKSFRSMTIGMDMTSKEAKKMQNVIGSAAYSLNEDMNDSAQTWVAFRKQNIDLTKAMGSKGTEGAIRKLIKTTAMYNLEGAQLSNIYAGHIKGFGFTEERVTSLADKLVYLGSKFDMGKEAIQAWPSILESLNKELADFGRNATPEDIEQLTTSIVALGAGFKESLGVTGQEGIEMARNVFTSIMGERKNLLQMSRSMTGELGDFAMQLSESGGSVEGMFKMIMQDPLHFMESLRQLSKRAEEYGGTMGVNFQRLSGVINSSLGEGVTFAMKGNWDKFHESVAQVPKYLSSPEAKGAFTGFAETAFTTGRSLQERWDFALENMRHSLMSISRPFKEKWVNTMTRGFRDTTKAIRKLSEDKGPVGDLTKKFLLLRDIGPAALIPELGQLSGAFGGALTSMLPFMTAFGAMGIKFRDVGKMALAGGGLYALFKILEYGPEKAWEKFKEFGNSTLKLIDAIFPKLNLGVKLKGFFGDISGGPLEAISKIFSRIGKEISELWGRINWDRIFEVVGNIFRKTGEIISKFLAKIDWGAVGKTLVNFIIGAFKLVGEIIGGLFSGLFNPETIEKDAKKPLEAGFSNAIVGALFAVIKGGSGIIKGIFEKFWGYLFDAKSASDAISRFGKLLVGTLTPVLGLAIGVGFKTMMSGGGFVSGFGKVFGMFGKFAKILGPSFIAIRFFIELLGQVKTRMENISTIMESKLVPDISKTALVGEQAFTGMSEAIDSAFFGLPGMIGKYLGITKDDMSIAYHSMVALTEHGMNYIHSIISSIADNISWTWKQLPNVIGSSIKLVTGVISYAFEIMKNNARQASIKVEGWISGLVSVFENVWIDIRHAIEDSMEDSFIWMAKKFIWLSDFVPKALLPDEWVSSAKKFVKEFEITGGVYGREKRQEKEKIDLQQRRLLITKSLQDELDKMDKEEKRLADQVLESRASVDKEFNKFVQGYEKIALKTAETFDEREAGIEKTKLGNIQASRIARAEIEAKKVMPEMEEVTEGKKPKKKRPPTHAERVADEAMAVSPMSQSEAANAVKLNKDLTNVLSELRRNGIPVQININSGKKLKGLLDFSVTGNSNVVAGL